jgi:anthranilate synthase component 2
VTAETDDGEIMAVMHIEYPIFGVQFHPESILTPDGPFIISNFLSIKKEDPND